MEFLVKQGVRFGEDGISHTTSRHRRKYYLCMSLHNYKLHEEYIAMLYGK